MNHQHFDLAEVEREARGIVRDTLARARAAAAAAPNPGRAAQLIDVQEQLLEVQVVCAVRTCACVNAGHDGNAITQGLARVMGNIVASMVMQTSGNMLAIDMMLDAVGEGIANGLEGSAARQPEDRVRFVGTIPAMQGGRA